MAEKLALGNVVSNGTTPTGQPTQTFEVTRYVDPSALPGVNNPLLGANPADLTKVERSNTETCAAQLAYFQNGTLLAPESFVPWYVQPRDGTKAPFQCLIAGGQFNATWDSTLSIGYNTDVQHADACLFDGWEQDYEVSPGVHWFERYAQYLSADKLRSFRPWYFNVDKGTDIGQLLFALPGPVRQGSLSILSGDGTQNYLTLTDVVGFAMRNSLSFSINDNTVTPRGAIFANSVNQFAVGDFAWAASFFIGKVIQLITGTGPGGDILKMQDGTVTDAFIFSTRTTAGGVISMTIKPSPTAPAAPAAGFTMYVDPADGKLKVIGSGGTITTLAVP